ncbi:MAG: molybdopterin-dependent oxidoreductase [Gammaproteobacteria bacterium]|nr:molybdopterin-dependent oxidoreductase [Gammaproteobacteria bacterium]
MSANNIEVIRRICPTCEACCGLVMEVDRTAQKIISIKGDPQDHRSRGYVCAKSQAFNYIYEDGERLRHPVKRTKQGWEQISWTEAFDTIASKFTAIRDTYGKDALSIYVGNPLGHDFAAGIYLQSLMASVGTERFFSAGTVDQHPQQMVCWGLIGHEWLFPVPDLERTELFICMGANPVVSQGSILGTPNMEAAMRAIQARGGRCIAIDPRRTETAAIADQHLFIQPGTDAYFLMAFANELFLRDAIDLGHLAEHVDNLQALQETVSAYTADNTAAVTGVSASDLRALVDAYLAANGAALYGRIGLCTQEFGLAAHWMLMVISLISGNFDTAGGMMLSTAPTGDSGPGAPGEVKPYGRWHSRVRGVPETCGELPASLMAEEITAPGEEVHGLLTICGNPVLSVPRGDRIREALGTLDFMVALDIYINETTSQADIILPSTVHPEHSNIDVTFQNFTTRNYVSYSPRTFEPEPELKDLGEIILEISARMSGLSRDEMDGFIFQGMVDTVLKRAASAGVALNAEQVTAAVTGDTSPERFADLLIRSGPYGDWFGLADEGISLERLKAHPQASMDLGPLQSRLPGMLRTPGQRIDLLHEVFANDLQRLRAGFEQRVQAPQGRKPSDMLLIGRRHVRDMNSWLHNLKPYVRGKNRCTARLHSSDASALGLQDGALARVTSNVGQALVPVEVTDEMMPGVISIPHGFGHIYADSAQTNAAAILPGVSCNNLIDESLDEASSTCVVNGVPVSVAPA